MLKHPSGVKERLSRSAQSDQGLKNELPKTKQKDNRESSITIDETKKQGIIIKVNKSFV